MSLLLLFQTSGSPPSFIPAWADDINGYSPMKKNVAGQVVGVQMNSATDGSAFTGSVTVSVTVDGGVQATGSVGSGACTHEGNGYHTYLPAQAETNGDLLAFTFTGTGAIPRTVQSYTSFPQTGDSYARIGAPAGASISADVAGVQSDTNDIQTRLPAALVSGRMDSSVGAMAANVLTAAATAADFGAEMATAIWTDTVAGNYTVALSIGKSIMNGVALGTGLTINGYTGNTVQTGDSFARIGLNGAGLTNIDLPDQTMNITGNITGNLSGSVGSVTGAVGSVTGAVGSVTGLTASDVGAIKAKTDSLTFTKALELDTNIQSVNGVTVNGDGAGTPMGV